MARVPYVEKEACTGEARQLYDTFVQRFSVKQVPNVVKALSNSPKLASRVFPSADYFMNDSSLEQATTRVT